MLPLPTFLPAFTANSRLLVFAPHPDDETLATGELILAARHAGAKVRVMFATDGDNNPWPQRWIEKRWQIDSDAQAAWGVRRRSEAIAALEVLGVDQSDARFLGWPDQGLTDCLMRDDSAECVLAEEISGFAPTHVALPSLSDRHPDHGALGMLVDLALRRSGVSCERLEFVVHGTATGKAALEHDAAHKQCKQRALLQHASQLHLSGDRLRRIADREECFTLQEAEPEGGKLDIESGKLSLRMPLTSMQRLRGYDLLIVLLQGSVPVRRRIALPRMATTTSVPIGDSNDSGFSVRTHIAEGVLQASLEGLSRDITGGYVKLERRWPRLVVFDTGGWHDLRSLLVGDRAEASQTDINAEFAAPQRSSEISTIRVDI